MDSQSTSSSGNSTPSAKKANGQAPHKLYSIPAGSFRTRKTPRRASSASEQEIQRRLSGTSIHSTNSEGNNITDGVNQVETQRRLSGASIHSTNSEKGNTKRERPRRHSSLSRNASFSRSSSFIGSTEEEIVFADEENQHETRPAPPRRQFSRRTSFTGSDVLQMEDESNPDLLHAVTGEYETSNMFVEAHNSMRQLMVDQSVCLDDPGFGNTRRSSSGNDGIMYGNTRRSSDNDGIMYDKYDATPADNGAFAVEGKGKRRMWLVVLVLFTLLVTLVGTSLAVFHKPPKSSGPTTASPSSSPNVGTLPTAAPTTSTVEDVPEADQDVGATSSASPPDNGSDEDVDEDEDEDEDAVSEDGGEAEVGTDDAELATEEVVEALKEEEQDLLDEAEDAETPVQKEALKAEAEILEQLVDIETEEEELQSKLDEAEANGDEEELDVLIREEQQLNDKEDLWSMQADLLDQEANAETSEERQHIEELVAVQRKQMDSFMTTNTGA